MHQIQRENCYTVMTTVIVIHMAGARVLFAQINKKKLSADLSYADFHAIVCLCNAKILLYVRLYVRELYRFRAFFDILLFDGMWCFKFAPNRLRNIFINPIKSQLSYGHVAGWTVANVRRVAPFDAASIILMENPLD